MLLLCHVAPSLVFARVSARESPDPLQHTTTCSGCNRVSATPPPPKGATACLWAGVCSQGRIIHCQPRTQALEHLSRSAHV
jgi:hypothetical protein